MNDIPFSLFKRPALWQRSQAAFWDDEHISKHMLAAHLDGRTDAASRTNRFMDRSVEWLSTFLPSGAHLLDLGCGPGLYGARFAARGYRVTGVDFSRRSIAYAQAHDPVSKYIYKNYLTLDDQNAFDAVTLIYCDYAALIPSERKALLQNVYRALRPGGVFILDVFTPAHYASTVEATSWDANENGGFWSPEPYVCLEAKYLYENRTVSASRYVVITKKGVTEHIVWDTSYTRESLTAEVSAAGFLPEAFFGSVSGAPFSEESETMCCIARKENALPRPREQADLGLLHI